MEVTSEPLVLKEMTLPGIQTLSLNQPSKKNAMNALMMQQLEAALHEAERDPSVRVVVLRGAHDVFSSGGDLNQAPAQRAGLEGKRESLSFYTSVIRCIRAMSTPVIAVVCGYAVGGAFALALACDLVYADDQAIFIPAFCQIGIVPEMGMMATLTEIVGLHKAKEILLLGGRISARNLETWGVINQTYPHTEVYKRALEQAKKLSEMPDAAIALTKRMMNSLSDSSLGACLSYEEVASPFCTTTEAFARATERFSQ